MDDESILGVTGIICAFLIAATLCLAGKSCNDSDNAVKTKILEKGCSYLGDGKFVCPGSFSK